MTYVQLLTNRQHPRIIVNTVSGQLSGWERCRCWWHIWSTTSLFFWPEYGISPHVKTSHISTPTAAKHIRSYTCQIVTVTVLLVLKHMEWTSIINRQNNTSSD